MPLPSLAWPITRRPLDPRAAEVAHQAFPVSAAGIARRGLAVGASCVAQQGLAVGVGHIARLAPSTLPARIAWAACIAHSTPRTTLPAAIRELPAPPAAATAVPAAVDLLDMAPGG
jgi:hypothetical protein